MAIAGDDGPRLLAFGSGKGFTDAARLGEDVLFAASAEASDDAVSDGDVTGSVLGVIKQGGEVRYAPLVDDAGRLLAEKVEGIVLSRRSDRMAYVVLDPDDPARPAEFCEVAMMGSWDE